MTAALRALRKKEKVNGVPGCFAVRIVCEQSEQRTVRNQSDAAHGQLDADVCCVHVLMPPCLYRSPVLFVFAPLCFCLCVQALHVRLFTYRCAEPEVDLQGQSPELCKWALHLLCFGYF